MIQLTDYMKLNKGKAKCGRAEWGGGRGQINIWEGKGENFKEPENN
jgi:hypothetical protein